MPEQTAERDNPWARYYAEQQLRERWAIQAAAIREAERRVIEAAKAWGCSANSAHPTLDASRKLVEAVCALREAERG